MKRIFILQPEPHTSRRLACQAIGQAPDGYMVRISEPTRSLMQNALFHDLCGQLAGQEWAGKPRGAAAWKVLLVSGHAMATKEGADVVPGLENEFVNLRESTALMSKKRGSSLIEYTQAFIANRGVTL